MNNNLSQQNAAPPQGGDLQAFFSQQYNKDEFKAEFNEKFKQAWRSMPLFVCILVTVKVCLYISSFFTSALNDVIALNSIETFTSFQIWRLLTGPMATDSLVDVLFVLPYYIIKIINQKEHLQGTASVTAEFIIKSMFFGIVYAAVALIFGPHNSYVCGIFPLVLAEISQKLFAEPQNEADLCLFKLSNRNYALVLLAFFLIFFDYPLSIMSATFALSYFNPIQKLGEAKVQSLTSKLEKFVAKSERSVTFDQVQVNQKTSTDHLKSFDRNQNRGRVGSLQQQQPVWASSPASTRPSSSASSVSGISLGGNKNRDDSNLLNLSSPQVLATQDSQEETDAFEIRLDENHQPPSFPTITHELQGLNFNTPNGQNNYQL